MSVLGKLKFWKKEEALLPDFNDPNMPAPDLGLPAMDPGLPSPMPDPSLSPPSFSQDPMSEHSQQNPQPFPGSDQGYISPPNQIPPRNMPNFSGNPDILSKDIEVMNSKLDVLRAGIDNISQRLESIERLARDEREKPKKYEW